MTTIIVATIRMTQDRIICHKSIVCPVANRSIIVVDVAGGKNDTQVATVPFGSRTIMIQINIGNINNIQTGKSIVWASLSCETLAPTAMNIDAKNKTPKT